jgi:hypothetical protein
MQDDDSNRGRPDVQGADVRGPETRTTAFLGQSCERCGVELTGRKTRFCSDRCRMAVRRERRAERIRERFLDVEQSLAALRDEVEASE